MSLCGPGNPRKVYIPLRIHLQSWVTPHGNSWAWHLGTNGKSRSKVLCSPRMGIWPISQKISWLLSLFSGLFLLQTLHSPSSDAPIKGSWQQPVPPQDKAEEMATSSRLKILVCDESTWNWVIRESQPSAEPACVTYSLEPSYTINRLWPHRKREGSHWESHFNSKGK